MLREFRAFIARGNVVDLAVAVIIGAAFTRIVGSLTDDIIMPVVGLVTGGHNFDDHYIVLAGQAPAGATLAEAKLAGANVLSYGVFVGTVVNFLILAFVIFLLVRQAKRILPPDEGAPAGPTEVELLQEIRDALQKR